MLEFGENFSISGGFGAPPGSRTGLEAKIRRTGKSWIKCGRVSLDDLWAALAIGFPQAAKHSTPYYRVKEIRSLVVR